MADPIATPNPMPEVAPAPAPVQTPAAPAVQTPPPSAAAPAPQPTEFELRPEYELQHPDLGRPVKVAELITSYRDADLIRRAEAGDSAAQEAILQRLASKIIPGRGPNPAPTQQPQNPAAPAADPEALLSKLGITKDQLQEAIAFTSQQRTEAVRTQMAKALESPEFSAIRQRGVDYVLKELREVHAQLPPGTKITSQVIVNTLKALNQQEQGYIDRLVQPYRDLAGELGADDPFRGGQPDPANDPRPNSQKEPAKYQQWLARQVAFARRQEALANRN